MLMSWDNPSTKGILLKTRAPLKHVLEPKDKRLHAIFMLFCLHPPSSNGRLHLPPAPSPGPADSVSSAQGRGTRLWLPLQTLRPLCTPIRALKSVLQGNTFVLLSSMNRLPFFF